MTPELLTAPMSAIQGSRGQAQRSRVDHDNLALWGCYHKDVGFWCRPTITGAVVAALKRDPHGQYLTGFRKPEWVKNETAP